MDDSKISLSGYNAAWLAGYLDADGCITLGKLRPNGCRTPEIRLTSSDKELLDRVCDLVGGKVSRASAIENRIQQWQIRISGALGVIYILRRVLPFMHRKWKIARAMILVNEWEACMINNGCHYTPEMLDKRLEIQERFLALGSSKSMAAQRQRGRPHPRRAL